MDILALFISSPDYLVYLAVFLAALVETAPFIGLFLPGQVVVIIGGVAAQQGLIRFPGVVLAAALGAVLGDWIGYRLGRTYGEAWFKKHRKLFLLEHVPYDRAKYYFKKYGGITVLLGRFYNITRSFTPFIAGTARMRRSVFILYNMLGSLLWGFVSVLVGYIFGEAYPVIEKILGRMFLLSLVVLILVFLGFRYYKKLIGLFRSGS